MASPSGDRCPVSSTRGLTAGEHYIRAFWHAAWDTSPGTLPRRLEALLDELARFVLPERRPRHYPRAVKIKMSNYPRNRPHRRRFRAK
jgi:hypothetical protein